LKLGKTKIRHPNHINKYQILHSHRRQSGIDRKTLSGSHHPIRIIRLTIIPILEFFPHLDFSPKIAIFILSCKEIRWRRRRNGQAGARPCKTAVGNAGHESEKPPQSVDIHQAFLCANAPLSAL